MFFSPLCRWKPILFLFRDFYSYSTETYSYSTANLFRGARGENLFYSYSVTSIPIPPKPIPIPPKPIPIPAVAIPIPE